MTMHPQKPNLRFVIEGTSDALAKLNRRLPAPLKLTTARGAPIAGQLLDTATDALWLNSVLLIRADNRLLAVNAEQNHWLDVGNRPVVFVKDIDDGALRKTLGSVPTLRSLRPRLNLALKESSATLLDANDAPCAHLRVITLRGKHGSGALLELHPVQGHEEANQLLGEQLRKIGALELEPSRTIRSVNVMRKLVPNYRGRGYAPNPGVTLHQQMSVKHAATTMISTYIGVARRNEAGIIADLDTEYLHDYRVSLRRVRSIISLFKGAYHQEQQQALNTRLANLMRQTNRLRDLDVYLLEEADDYAALPSSLHEGLSQIFAAFSTEREAEWQRLANHLQSRAYRLEIRTLQRTFAQDARLEPGHHASKNCRQQAAKLISQRYRKVCKIAAGIDDQTPDDTVHKLRLQCKKLRYLLDLSGPLFDKKKVKEIIKPLKRLQDNLGSFNDYSVQQLALQQFLDQQLQHNPNTKTQMIEAIGALIAIKHQQQARERALVMQNFAEFHVPATDALFEALFSKEASPVVSSD
jgi:CHAD domain-containing protein